MSRKLQASFKKIDDVFGQMFEKGITVDENKSAWGDKTPEIYGSLMKSLMKDIHEEFKVADIKKITPEQVRSVVMNRAEKFHTGETKEAFNAKTVLAAVKAFTVGSRETNVFKGKEINLGDTGEIRKELKESNITRHAKSSSILRATPTECEKVLSNIKNGGYDTPIRTLAYNVSRVAFETGGRISAVLRLSPEDIDFKNNTITYEKDKGGLTRTVKIDQTTSDYLKSICVGKESNQMIFGAKKQDKKFKSVTETAKAIQRIVRDAGAEFTVTEKVSVKTKDGKKTTVDVEKKFTPHSFRKGYAMNRAKEYFDKLHSKSATKRYVAKRIEQDSKLKGKIDTFRKFVNKDRKTPRALTREEYAIFFTSVDLGHYRASVINDFYTTMKEVSAYFSNKK